MNPGAGKVHRACATRCISGGVPPILAVRAEGGGGDFHHILLVGERGQAVNQEILPFVAEPVEITGTLEKSGDLWILRAAPSTYRRLS